MWRFKVCQDLKGLVDLKGLDTPKPPHPFCILIFDILPFTDNASIVNGKTSKKSMQKCRGIFWCYIGIDTPKTAVGLDTPKTAATFLHAFL